MNHPKTLSDKIKYEITRVIAEGGMGTVYEAYQHGSNGFKKQVAIKLILQQYSAINEFRNNFVGEAKLVADLIHTNIVQTYHLGMVDLQYYMVMEYVNGINLEDFICEHITQKKKVPVDLATFIVSRICRGLSYAHTKKSPEGEHLQIVHRDISPKNIMISFEGDVKITDFGIAKAKNLMYNKEGEVIAGKDEYLSPEQARKEVTDHRADLFGCGILLAELLLGYNPFYSEDPKETHRRIINAVLPDFKKENDKVDDKLILILSQALQPSRDKRFQSAWDFLTKLETYLYSDGYGPTNEKLAIYVKNLFNPTIPTKS